MHTLHRFLAHLNLYQFCSVTTWIWNGLEWDFYNLIYTVPILLGKICWSAVRWTGGHWWTTDSGLWLGPFKHILVLNHQRWDDSMLMSAVLLESEPQPQSQVSCRLENLIFAYENNPLNMLLPPSCFTVGMEFSLWWTVLGFANYVFSGLFCTYPWHNPYQVNFSSRL